MKKRRRKGRFDGLNVVPLDGWDERTGQGGGRMEEAVTLPWQRSAFSISIFQLPLQSGSDSFDFARPTSFKIKQQTIVVTENNIR